MCRESRQHRQAQWTGASILFQAPDRIDNPCKALGQFRREPSSRLRQFKGWTDPAHEGQAEAVLETSKLMTDGRRGHAKLHRCVLDRQMSCGRLEGAQRVERDIQPVRSFLFHDLSPSALFFPIPVRTNDPFSTDSENCSLA